MNESREKLRERIEELESQAAFQDQLHETLNAAVARQDSEIMELKRHVGLLFERLKDMGEAAPGAQAQDEVPPHY